MPLDPLHNYTVCGTYIPLSGLCGFRKLTLRLSYDSVGLVSLIGYRKVSGWGIPWWVLYPYTLSEKPCCGLLVVSRCVCLGHQNTPELVPDLVLGPS